ncbi:MAG: hypothetical protein R3F19_12760 [Verrucomicrobiales bacterium]
MDLLSDAFRGWKENDESTAGRWLAANFDKLTEAQQQKLKPFNLPRAISDAVAYAADQDVPTRESTLRAIARREVGSPSAVRDFLAETAAKMPDAFKSASDAIASEVYQSGDFSSAMSLMQTLGDLPAAERLQVAESIAWQPLLANTRSTPLPAVSDWLLEQTPDEKRGLVMSRFVGRWATRDFNAAGEWIRQQSQANWRDEVIDHYAQAILPMEPKSAVDWAASISDAQMRAASIAKIYEQWSSNDAAAAEKYFGDRGGAEPEPQR